MCTRFAPIDEPYAAMRMTRSRDMPKRSGARVLTFAGRASKSSRLLQIVDVESTTRRTRPVRWTFEARERCVLTVVQIRRCWRIRARRSQLDSTFVIHRDKRLASEFSNVTQVVNLDPAMAFADSVVSIDVTRGSKLARQLHINPVISSDLFP